MSITDQPAIRVEHLIKSYAPERPNAVDGINFEIAKGTIFGLLGPNGAGKTTTIKMILGLVLPSSGSVHLAGYDMSKERNRALRHAGAILEGSRNVYWRLSARANLEYFGALRGLKGNSRAQRIQEVLELVELADRADEEVRYLSRGMQQKVALATAILHDPDVLLLDEPTLGLDVQAARTIEKVIRQFVTQHGKTVVLTTHQMPLAERLSDSIFLIDKGKRIAEGATREVIDRFGGQRETMEIELAGEMSPHILGRLQLDFTGLSATPHEENTILSWIDSGSQKEFLRLQSELDEAGLTILQAGRRAATLEEVFVQLTSHPEKRTR
ncbi:MAG TPA: ABC transporter ATP-binding protein [Anaerolineales bacterium]|nr:ABC transporter ATP-binding protein [Anaerolineales bacterium]